MGVNSKTIKFKAERVAYYLDAPLWNGTRCAAIGDLNLTNVDDGKSVLELAIEQARADGVAAVLGPMNGDTWHSYRSVLESDGSAPFMLEPTSGPHDLECLKAAGFEAVSYYVSTRGSLADALGPKVITVDGIEIAAWDGGNAESLIMHLFEMSKASFAKNNFYKPVTLEDFQSLYRPLLGAIDPRFVLIAKTGSSQICGFLFGFPDVSAPPSNPTVILKTYASGKRGVGHALADKFHRNAVNMGFRSVIHALMHEDNISLKRSRQHQANVFRRYVLLAKTL